MSPRGWVRLHRQFLQSPVWDNPNAARLFLYLLLRASYKPERVVMGQVVVDVLRGQVLFGRRAAAEAIGLSERQVRTALKLLELGGVVSVEATNRYSVLTIRNYELYQQNDQPNDQQESGLNCLFVDTLADTSLADRPADRPARLGDQQIDQQNGQPNDQQESGLNCLPADTLADTGKAERPAEWPTKRPAKRPPNDQQIDHIQEEKKSTLSRLRGFPLIPGDNEREIFDSDFNHEEKNREDSGLPWSIVSTRFMPELQTAGLTDERSWRAFLAVPTANGASVADILAAVLAMADYNKRVTVDQPLALVRKNLAAGVNGTFRQEVDRRLESKGQAQKPAAAPVMAEGICTCGFTSCGILSGGETTGTANCLKCGSEYAVAAVG